MVLDQQEGSKMEEQESITLNMEVKVLAKNGEATVSVPPEVRLTERLVNHLDAALRARELQLRHWTLTVPEQEEELRNLPNVSMEQNEEE